MEMQDLGSTLVKAGLRTAIIVAETNMTRKQITAARKKMGIKGNTDSGPLPQAESLLSSRPLTLEASLFMHAYLLVAKQPKSGVDIRAVLAAHSHYVECHASIRSGRIETKTLLELDRAWVLARDYRSMVVGMRTCHSCSLEFVASINDRRHACPICSGVNIATPVACSKLSSARALSDFIEISQKVKIQINWGNSSSEIIEDLGLSPDEYDLCVELSRLSSKELKSLAESNHDGAQILEMVRGASTVAAI